MTGGGMTAALSLCFIGGWGSTEAVWRSALQGAGGIDAAPGEPRFVSWLDCIRDWPAVLAALGALPGRCVLVGWSLGSLFALRAALELELELEMKWERELEPRPKLEGTGERPGRIAAMVLVSATPRMCAAKNYGGVDPRMLAAMRARMERTPGAVLEEFAGQCAAPDGDEETRQDWLRQARQFSAAEMAAGLDCLASLDLRERLGGIGVPCRILHGECDRIVPLGSAEFLAGRIAGAELEVLAGRGHALPFTAPAEVARSIASVLR